jgi:transcriptional regulator with XRE-family HTH domain
LKTIYHPRDASLVEKLIFERKIRGITQVQLANKLGKHQSYVAKIEGCERRLDVLEFVEWCSSLGLVASEYVKKIE